MNEMANILKENARKMSILSIHVENKEIPKLDLFFKLKCISKNINDLLEKIENIILNEISSNNDEEI